MWRPRYRSNERRRLHSGGKPASRAPGPICTLGRTLKFAFLRAGATAVPRVPASVAYALAAYAGTLAYMVSSHSRRAVTDNLRHVLGPTATSTELARTTRRIFRSVARSYVDLLASRAADVDALRRGHVRVEGYANLTAALAAGHGVILASVHYGCPEIPLQAARAWGLHFLVLTEPLEPPRLSELFIRLRASHGHQNVPVGFAGLKQAIRTLRRGGIVLLLVDRDIQGTGLRVPFFGAEAALPPGAVELSRATGARIVPVLSRREDRGSVVTIQPELPLVCTADGAADLRANLTALIQRFEPQIRADPGQWLVLQPLWRIPDGQCGT
jgi:lauroyl/myristoyl acyltransferase